MLHLILDLLIFLSLGIIIYIFARALPRVRDDISDSNKIETSKMLFYLEKADDKVKLFTEKFLRRVKIITLKFENLINIIFLVFSIFNKRIGK